MKLILAQGNPGSEFKNTRHNVGFWLLDAYASTHNIDWSDIDWSEKTKFHSYIGECSLEGEKILLVKPTTYYNDTGIAARALVDFYKLDPATGILVIHDDLMLPLGTIRTREKGSDAGNNGIKSLSAHLGQDYKRARIGIWSELADRMDATAFVLGKFTADERAVLSNLQPVADNIIDTFVAGNFETTSRKA